MPLLVDALNMHRNSRRTNQFSALHLALRLGELDHFVILFYERQQGRRVSNRKIRKKLIGFRREQSAKSEADQGSVQCTGKQLQVRIQIFAFEEIFQITKASPKEQKIEDQRRNSALDCNLQVSHMHFAPHRRIGFEVLRTDTQ